MTRGVPTLGERLSRLEEAVYNHVIHDIREVRRLLWGLIVLFLAAAISAIVVLAQGG